MYAYAGQAIDTQSLDVANAKTNAMEVMLNTIEPNAAFGKMSYTDEVAAYQKAGQYGVQQIAPAIDAAGVADTKPLTHTAWDINAHLHSDISGWGPLGPGYTDVLQARGLAWQMLLTYKKALLAGRQAALQATQQSRTAAPTPQQAPQAPAPVQAAAQALLAAIRATSAAGQPVLWTAAHGQGSGMWRPTYNFQQAYGHLKVDGVYGTQTAKALQAIVGPGAVSAASGPGAAVAGYGSGAGGAPFGHGWIAGTDNATGWNEPLDRAIFIGVVIGALVVACNRRKR